MSSFQVLEDYTRRLRASQDNARRAAMDGAVRAFPAHGETLSAPVYIPSRTPGAFAAANAASGRLQHVASSEAPSLASNHASSAATHVFPKGYPAAHNQPPSRTHSPARGLDRNPSRRSSANSLVAPSLDGTARGKSPSNIAAVLAASRFVPSQAPAVASARPKSWVIDQSLLHRHHSPLPELEQDDEMDADEEDEAEVPPDISQGLPPPGTVHGVRSWLEALEPHEESRKKPSLVSRSPAPISSRRQRPKNDIASLDGAGSASKSKVKIEKELVSVASSTDIKSPRPIRVPSTRSQRTVSLEGSVLSQELQRSSSMRKRPMVPEKKPSVRRLSVPMPVPTNPPQPATSPEDSAFTTPPLFPQEVAARQSMANALEDVPPLMHSKQRPVPNSLEVSAAELKAISERTGRPMTRAMEPSGPLALDIPRPISGGNLMPLVPTPSPSPMAALHGSLAAVAVSQPSTSPRPFTQRRVSPHMTGDSLANAIVASSLASSRAPSPVKTPQSTITRKSLDRPRTPFQHFKHTYDARTPSPGKYTFRKMQSSEDEALSKSYKVSRNFLGMRQHPNKHREGDRKRWRWEITAAERKRYEGVWAANKGLLLLDYYRSAEPVPDDVLRDSVSNLVARDIWSRSRLPDHVLEEVWDLVDRQQVQRLEREEFVVGLWLIDQRLKGKKLPPKVSESVWNSARGTGVRIPSFGK